ncbi:hypothetical protein AB1Y20_000831 [Prymnesium parvum]|uniref:Uncharacterized protein n=1 Tax=Prymnesium parvum TaxID=97485 RepID=A0AB34K9S8_PRYPA
MRLFPLLLLAAASPARSVHLSLGRGVLTGPASSDVSHALSSVRALGVKQVLLLHCAPADESHLSAGRVDALVSQPGVGLEAQLRELRDAFGCDGWFHLATTVEECSYAKQLGAKVILLDEAAAADDALETLGFVAMAIIDDFAESVCASLAELLWPSCQRPSNRRARWRELAARSASASLMLSQQKREGLLGNQSKAPGKRARLIAVRTMHHIWVRRKPIVSGMLKET